MGTGSAAEPGDTGPHLTNPVGTGSAAEPGDTGSAAEPVPPLLQRLAVVLADVLPVEEEADGALMVSHAGTLASLRVVSIVEDLDLVSLTQIVAWDLPSTNKLKDKVAGKARAVNFGSVTMVEKVADHAAQRNSGKSAAKTADVMLRYNFPGAGLTDDALRTLILLVLEAGAQIRTELTG